MTVPCEQVNEEHTVKPTVWVVTTEGHALSLKNVVSLLQQCSGKTTPSIVGGFRQWKEKGRTVKKGEKALKVFAPTKGKAAEPDPQEKKDNAENDAVPKYYRMVNVFDISQTTETQEVSNS